MACCLSVLYLSLNSINKMNSWLPANLHFKHPWCSPLKRSFQCHFTDSQNSSVVLICLPPYTSADSVTVKSAWCLGEGWIGGFSYLTCLWWPGCEGLEKEKELMCHIHSHGVCSSCESSGGCCFLCWYDSLCKHVLVLPEIFKDHLSKEHPHRLWLRQHW